MAACTSASSLQWALTFAAMLLLHSVETRKLPDFIPKCSIKLPIPELEKCVLASAHVTLPRVVHGSEGLRLPDMDPIAIPQIRIQTGTSASNLDMTANNIVLRGLADTNILHLGMPKDGLYTATGSIPRLEVVTDYVVDGKVLLLPIKGNGKANFTFENAFIHYEQPYSLYRKNGHDYLKFLPGNAKFNCTLAYFDMENLFNGDEKLGNTINKFMNENWRQVVDDLGQPFVDAAAVVISQFSQGIVANVPYDEIYNDVELPK